MAQPEKWPEFDLSQWGNDWTPEEKAWGQRFDLLHESGTAQLLDGLKDQPPSQQKDPFQIMSRYAHRDHAFVAQILGPRAPLAQRTIPSPERIRTYGPVLTEMVKDSCQRWSTFFAAVPNEKTAVLQVVRHTADITAKYATLMNVLYALKHPKEQQEVSFRDFPYRLFRDHDRPQDKRLRLHGTVPYFQMKEEAVGNGTLAAINTPGIRADIVLLAKNPQQYHDQLRDLRVLELLKHCAEGRYYLPEHIRKQLQQLDYIIFHEETPRHITPFAPYTDKLSDPQGIVLVTRGTPWITPEGRIAKSYKGESYYDYLGIPHEVQHISDHKHFPIPGSVTYVVTEARAISAELQTAARFGWQTTEEVALKRDHLSRFIAIMAGKWNREELPHTDEGARLQCDALLYDLPEKQLRQHLPAIKAYLAS